MRYILTILKIFSLTVGLVFLEYASHYFLPYPLANINLVFVALVVLIMGWETPNIIWLSGLFYFLLELYAVYPFGVVLISGVLSTSIIFILYKNIFTNRSWFSGLALAIFMVFIYNFLQLLVYWMFNFGQNAINVNWKLFFINFLWEVLFTGLATAVLIFIFSKIWNRFMTERRLI